MIKNSNLTLFHKTFNKTTRLEEWTRYNYQNVWFFDKESATIDKGYDTANRVEIRIPLDESIVDNFALGDIIVKGTLNINISCQQDLKDYQIYNITSKSVNNFGTQPHIHLGGR